MAAAVVVVALGVGNWVGRSFGADSLAQLAKIEMREVKVQRAVKLALEVPRQAAQSRKHYWSLLKKDAKEFGVKAPRKSKWLAAQRYQKRHKKSKILQAKQRWSTGPLLFKVKVEKVAYMRGGARVKSRHTILAVQNKGKHPVAYRVVARAKQRGTCEVRGTRRHNALVLAPRERAELTICAGKVAVEVLEASSTTLHPLSYRYLNQIPPQVFGLDAARSAAHRPASRTRVCTHLPAGKMARALKKGEIRWRDIVDYYRRHNCARFEMPRGYRAARKSLAELPVQLKASSAA